MLLPLRSWDPDKISYNRWNTDGASDVIYSSKQKLEKRQNISLEKTVLVTCKISDLYPLVPIQNNSLVHLVSSKRKYNMYIYISYISYISYIYTSIFFVRSKKNFWQNVFHFCPTGGFGNNLFSIGCTSTTFTRLGFVVDHQKSSHLSPFDDSCHCGSCFGIDVLWPRNAWKPWKQEFPHSELRKKGTCLVKLDGNMIWKNEWVIVSVVVIGNT